MQDSILPKCPNYLKQIQVQCNLNQNSSDRKKKKKNRKKKTEKNTAMYMEPYKNPNSHSNLEQKEQSRGTVLHSFKIY